MKKILEVILKYKIVILLILILNIMCFVFLWIVSGENIYIILRVFILFSIILYCFFIFHIYKIEKRREEAILDFLEYPDLNKEEKLKSFLSNIEKREISKLGEKLREKDEKIKEADEYIKEHKEYIEKWAHEVKNPVALMTFVLDNRKEEISKIAHQKLYYTRMQIEENVERMLYYSRMGISNSDHVFSKISLKEVLNDAILVYKFLIEEAKINIINEIEDINIVSDKKGLEFILRQIISNSIKYINLKEEKRFLHFFTKENKETGEMILTIRDNGTSVKKYDIPFLFNKGFTGENGERNKASTGMGLYLSKKVADNLKIKMEISKEYNEGFEISLFFPVIENA